MSDTVAADFALNLLRQSARPGTNAFLSPLSISVALAMTHVGACGETAHQMKHVLCGDTVTDEAMDIAFGNLQKSLNAGNDAYTLRVANRVYSHNKMTVKSAAMDKLKKHYDTDLRLVDFATKADQIKCEINAWVEKQTNDRIKKLIPDNVLNALTRMVLVNAIYFKGDWASPYDPDRTNKMPFYSAPGVEVQVDMMHQKDKFRFTQDKDVQVLGMQYKSPDLVFYAFLPTERNGLEAFEKSLTGAKLLEYIAQAHEQKVIVSFPKFRLEQSFDLGNALKALGMKDMFDPVKANFTNFAEPGKGVEDNLYVSAVLHKAFLEVDEKGAEAAAATAVVIGLMCAMSPPPKELRFIADHPFLIALVRDGRHVLFLGRYAVPA